MSGVNISWFSYYYYFLTNIFYLDFLYLLDYLFTDFVICCFKGAFKVHAQLHTKTLNIKLSRYFCAQS